MAMLTTIYQNSNSWTIRQVNTRASFGGAEVGAPSATGGTVPPEYKNNVQRFNEGVKGIYGEPSIYGDNPGFNFGFRQPYVWTGLRDSNFIKYIKKFDSRAFPIGSAAQDAIRMGKFLVSGKGVAFLATQFMLQGKQPFNETSLYNPLSIPQSVARTVSLGILPRARRHFDLSANGLLGFLGISSQSPSAPAGTAGDSALPISGIDGGKGLIRARTASAAVSRFNSKVGKGSGSPQQGILKNLMGTFLPGLQSITKPDGKFRADEKSYDEYIKSMQFLLFPKEGKNANTFSRLQFNIKLNKDDDSKFYFKDDSAEYKPDSNTVDKTSTEKIKKDQSQLDKLLKDIVDAPADPNYPQYKYPKSISDKKGVVNPDGGYYNTGVSKINGKSIKEDALENRRNLKFPNASSQKGERHDYYNNNSVLTSNQKPNKADDLISFYFQDLINDKYIPFRATLTGIGYTNNADWTAIQYIGRADKVYVYKGFSRELNFNFKVYANSKQEMHPMWQRINYLVGLTRPSKYNLDRDVPSAGYTVPPFVKLTIGDLFKNQPAIINSVNVNIPEDSPWEIDDGDLPLNGGGSGKSQLPMIVEISIGCILVEKQRPETNMLHFSDKPAEQSDSDVTEE